MARWGRQDTATLPPDVAPPADTTADHAVDLLNDQVRELQAEKLSIAERYQLMIDAAAIGLWDMSVVAGDPVNPRNEFWWSDQFRTMLGYRDETDFPNVLDSWASRLHPDDTGWVLEAFAAHLDDKTGRTPYDVEYRLKLKSGTYRWFRAGGSTRRQPDGTPVRVAGALRDINDEKSFLDSSSTLSERLRESSQRLADVSNDMARSTQNAVRATETAVAVIQKLDSSSTEIGKVVQLIATIAKQTNLLALNATIEAARAGEAGRGFAVVASEVKDLANETASATSEIGAQVGGIRSDTQSAVSAIEEMQGIIDELDRAQKIISSIVVEQQSGAQ
jgi:PAS domain S-box-containing protein